MSEILQSMIPLNFNDFMIKYGNESKESIIAKYKTHLGDKTMRDLKRMSRQNLMELLGKYHGIDIDKSKISNGVQKSTVAEILLDNIDEFMKNRIESRKSINSFPNSQLIAMRIPFENELKNNLPKAKIIKIMCFEFTHIKRQFMETPERATRALYFMDKPKIVPYHDFPFVKLIYSLLLDNIGRTEWIMKHTLLFRTEVEGLCMILEDKDKHMRLTMVNTHPYLPRTACKTLNVQINNSRYCSENSVDGNIFNMGKTFNMISVFDGMYICGNTPEELYKIVYEVTCANGVREIYRILVEKIKQLENSKKYLQMKYELMDKMEKVSFEELEMSMFKILKMKKTSLLPSNETSITEINATISEYKRIAKNFVDSTVRETMKRIQTSFNDVMKGISPCGIKIDIKNKKIDIGRFNIDPISVEIALRVIIIANSTETHSNILFVRDESCHNCKYEILSKLKYICPNILVFTDKFDSRTEF